MTEGIMMERVVGQTWRERDDDRKDHDGEGCQTDNDRGKEKR